MDPIVTAALVNAAVAALQAYQAYAKAKGLSEAEADAEFERIKAALAERDPALLKKVWEVKG